MALFKIVVWAIIFLTKLHIMCNIGMASVLSSSAHSVSSFEKFYESNSN